MTMAHEEKKMKMRYAVIRSIYYIFIVGDANVAAVAQLLGEM